MPDAVTGDLEQVRLSSVLQLAECEMFTGWLVLPRGRVGLHEGHVTTAACDGLDGLPALQEHFLTTRGAFQLRRDDTEVPTQMIAPMMALVMEGCRLADEWDRLRAMVLRVHPRFPPTPSDRLPSTFLDALDGEQTVADLAARLALPASRITDPLLHALERGELEHVDTRTPELDTPDATPSVAAPEPEPVVADDPFDALDYGTAIDQGRVHLRSREFAEAELAFRRALSLRPGDRIATQNLRRTALLREGGASTYDWYRTR